MISLAFHSSRGNVIKLRKQVQKFDVIARKYDEACLPTKADRLRCRSQWRKSLTYWLWPAGKCQGLFLSSSFIFTKAKTKEWFPQSFGNSLSFFPTSRDCFYSGIDKNRPLSKQKWYYIFDKHNYQIIIPTLLTKRISAANSRPNLMKFI